MCKELGKLMAEEWIPEVRGLTAVVAGLMVEMEKGERMKGLEVGSGSESKSESSEDSEEEPAEGMDEGV